MVTTIHCSDKPHLKGKLERYISTKLPSKVKKDNMITRQKDKKIKRQNDKKTKRQRRKDKTIRRQKDKEEKTKS